jgi:hypothetical protein
MKAKLLLLMSITLVGVSLFFSFTDNAWVWTGRQSENYPEIAFLLMYLPLSLLLVFDGLLLWRIERVPSEFWLVPVLVLISAFLKLMWYAVQILGLFADFESQTFAFVAKLSWEAFFPILLPITVLISGFSAFVSFKSK